MHSLKQGNFFTTKKNGYQYLEKKSNSKLIEGFIEANTNPNMNTNWKMFENHMVKHETAVGSEFKYDSSHTDVTHNIPGYNNMSVQEQEEKDNEILNAADATDADIYAIEILKNGKVLYYQKVNSGFPSGKTPTIYSQASAAKLFLKKNSEMVESIPSSIVTNDAIMDSLSLDSGNFNTVMSWYNTILNEYDLKLKEYYEKREAAAKEVDKGSPYKGKIISWQDNNTIKYAYINNEGVYRILDIPGLVGSKSGNVGGESPGDRDNRIKSGCLMLKVTPVGESPGIGLGLKGGVTTYTKWEGACFNPGLYYDDNANEFFVDHEGKVHKNPQGTGKCSEWGMNKIKVKAGTYDNIENVFTTQDHNCEYTLGNSDTDLVLLENRVKELNGELKTIAGNAEGNTGPLDLSDATKDLLEAKNMEKIDDSYTVTKGLLQILQEMPAKESDDMGYRKIIHALKNETSVKIPVKKGGDHTTMDISGILATQNELNQKMKELSNLGNNVASLESSMISKQEQIRAINLHFLAWGLAGITIGAIGLHTFFKK